MHDAILYAAIVWTTLLLGAAVLLLLRPRSQPGRIAALDMITLILVALLVIFAKLTDESYYLDAALALALLNFIATLAFARFSGRGRLFS